MDGPRLRKMDADTSPANDQKRGSKNGRKGNINGLSDRGGSFKQESRPTENIFLFYPNIIGMTPEFRLNYSKNGSLIQVQVIHVWSLLSRHSTTCHCIQGLVLFCTVSLVFSML